MNRRLPAVTGPRYHVRFNNGAHHVFDREFYAVVDAKPTAAAAQKRADELNARPRPQRRPGGRRP